MEIFAARSAAEETVDELDWKDVPPSRRPETRRRIAILEDYVSIQEPTEEDRQLAIRRLGVGRASFYRLVQIWNEHRKPALLPGANGSRSGRSKGRPLDPGIAEIIDEAIAKVGAASMPLNIEREVARLCNAAGLIPPSSAPIRRRRREALLEDVRSIAPILDGPGVIVDSCALDVPSILEGRPALPVVTAAFFQPEGWIAAYVVSDQPPTTAGTASAIRPLLAKGAPFRALVLHPQETTPWRMMTEALEAIGLPPAPHVRGDYGAVFGRIGGGSLGGLPLAARSTRRPVADSRNTYASREETLDVIREAVAIHNEARGGPTPPQMDRPPDHVVQFAVGDRTNELSDVLRWFENMPVGLRRTDRPS